MGFRWVWRGLFEFMVMVRVRVMVMVIVTLWLGFELELEYLYALMETSSIPSFDKMPKISSTLINSLTLTVLSPLTVTA